MSTQQKERNVILRLLVEHEIRTGNVHHTSKFGQQPGQQILL